MRGLAIQTANVSGQRRLSRILALQALFEVDLVAHASEHSLERVASERAARPSVLAFASQLVQGVLQQRKELDAVIQRHATQWPVAQLATVDRCILRLAIYELLIGRDAPPKAVINEAVELAKTFGSESSPRFVNGVLGAVMKEEFAATDQAGTAGDR